MSTLTPMALFQSGYSSACEEARTRFGLSTLSTMCLALYAPVALALYSALLAWPLTRVWAIRSAQEGHWIENSTFIALLLGAVLSLRLAHGDLKNHTVGWPLAFYCLFACGLFVTALEEISWGQDWINLPGMAALRSHNAQGDSTLHNLPAVQGMDEWLRVIFGVGGWIGTCPWLPWPLLRAARILSVAFWTLSVTGITEYAIEFHLGPGPWLHWATHAAEMEELILAITAALYLYLAGLERNRTRTELDFLKPSKLQ